jgi:Tol biopolymer transport system component
MTAVPVRFAPSLKICALALLALCGLAWLAVPSAEAGSGRIVVVAGKAKQCRGDACNNYDLVQSISPRGGERQVLARVHSAVETASTEDGTIAVLSKVIAGGGANSSAYTQVYLVGPDGRRREVFDQRLEGFNATGLGISGDGRLLALSGRYDDEYGLGSKVWLVRADGTGMRQLTRGPGQDAMPALSPDGRRVVFSRRGGDPTAGRKAELYTVGVEGGEPVRITENGLSDVNPVFSPDGRGIAFGQANDRANRGKVAVVRVDGSGLRTVASTGGEYPDPDYSPSGRSIAFVGEVPGRGYDTAIYTVRASGKGRALASAAFEFPGLPQWTRR